MSLFALLDASSDAGAAVQYAVAHHDVVLLAAGLVVLAVIIVLKALGKDIPLVDPLLDGALSIVENIRKPIDEKQDAPEAPAADPKPAEHIADVIPIVKPGDKGPQP